MSGEYAFQQIEDRADIVEPNWINITCMGASYDVEMDTNANPITQSDTVYRHRERRYTGQSQMEWVYGMPVREDIL